MVGSVDLRYEVVHLLKLLEAEVGGGELAVFVDEGGGDPRRWKAHEGDFREEGAHGGSLPSGSRCR